MKKIANTGKSQNGIALLIAVTVIAAAMLIAVLIANIVITQLKLAGDIGDSGVAIFAADSGIEWQLYQIRQGAMVPSPNMSNGAEISTEVVESYPKIIRSLGSFRTVKRQFEVFIY